MLWRQVLSQSPVQQNELPAARDKRSPYARSLARLNEILRHGGSLSGHETNSAFLNLEGRSFADVAAVAGFDFADDARAVAVTDWDGDGDMDVWTTNRTAPRLRFLRNETPSHNRFLAVRLQGTTCNRDAIGARVVLERRGQRLAKSIRAGEGFLSQSTKTLHFGLGADDHAVDRLTIEWPDGNQQVFRNLPVNHVYALIQGDPVPYSEKRPVRPLAIRPGPLKTAEEDGGARIVLSDRVPVPRLRFIPFERGSSTLQLPDHEPNPLLLTLWASWCGSCFTELSQLAESHEQLRAAGVTVYALSVDAALQATQHGGQESTARRTSHAAAELARQQRYPFPVGSITKEALEPRAVVAPTAILALCRAASSTQLLAGRRTANRRDLPRTG